MSEPSIFMQSVTSRHNMFPGADIAYQPDLNFSSIPGLSGPQGAMAAMFMDPIIKNMLGPGFIPGQFQPTHNLYDHYRRKMQYQSMQTAMSSASEVDKGQYTALLRGMAATAGVQWNDDRERAAQAMAGDMSKISPMLSQLMPETFDAMHGSRGSATMMARNMFQGGRYRLDPVSRTLGMSADSTSEMTKEIYDRLYGPGADLTVMKGLGAGRAGQLFDEMGRRGLMPRAMTREEQLRGIAREDLAGRGTTGAAAEAEMGKTLDSLRDLASPQLEAKVRQFEAGRVGDRIKSMAGAIAAMKEVFGERGRPDAPMSELIEGLQVITQGGLATMAPERVESLVRDTANIARRTGMGLDNMTMLMATSAQRADAMGLDRSFGVTAGMQAATFGSAYANTVGGTPAWGRGDKERMIAMDSNLRLNAANSQVANQLAATVRLGQEVGFTKGSEGEAMFRAIQAGETTYTFDGKSKNVYGQPGEWRSIMSGSGVETGLASAYRSQTAYNQKTIDEANLTGLSRKLQSDVDVAPRLNRAYQRAARQAGITDNAILGKLGQAAQEGLLNDLTPEDLQDRNKVAEYLADKAGVDKTDDVKMGQLRNVASLGWGNVEQMVKTNPRLRGYKTADQFVTAHRRATLTEAAREEDEIRQESRLQSALSGAAAGGPLERIIDAVSTATDETSVQDIMAKTLGWLPEGEVGQRLSGTVKAMQDEIRKFNDTDTEKIRREAKSLEQASNSSAVIGSAAAEDAKQRLQGLANKYTGGDTLALLEGKDLRKTVRDNAINKIKTMSPELRRQAEAAGVELGATATSEDAASAWRELRDKRGGAGVTATETLTDKMLHDNRSVSVLGSGGLSVVRRIQDRNRDLRDLAGRAADGDLGLLMATDEQRQQAREQYGLVTKGAADSKRLTKEVEAAEASGDIDTANRLRNELDETNKKVTAAQTKLSDLGSATGTTGEKLATGRPVDDNARAQANKLRTEQMKDVASVQEKLRAGKKYDMTEEEKKALNVEREARRGTEGQVVRDIFKTLGIEGTNAKDRDELSKELRGARGSAIRSALPALQRLREIQKDMTGEQFQQYLKKGLGDSASDEEKELYHRVAAGKAGGGLAGITKDTAGRDSVKERLRDFASWQKESAKEPEAKKSAGGKEITEITGTITIPGLGEGRLNASGGRR
jgi:hypothetical protein